MRTSNKKLKAKKQEAKAWLKTRLCKPVSETLKLISASLRGHYNYYGVNGNTRKIGEFYNYVKYRYFNILNRRDQKGKFRLEKFIRIWDYYVQKPRVCVKIWAL